MLATVNTITSINSSNIKNPKIILLLSSVVIASIIISSIIIISSTSLVYGSVTIPYLDQVNQNYDKYNKSLWSLGDNTEQGDYFLYRICLDDMMYQIIYPYHCYDISLEFVKILESYKGDTWIVQSYITVGNDTSPLILSINPITYDVSTDMLHRDVGASLEKTIFSLSQYGVQSLSIGTVWGMIPSYFTNDIPLEIKKKQSIQILNGTIIETSVLSYDVIVPSNTYIDNDYPFPLKAVTYSPNIIYPEPKEEYYYELLEYSRDYIIYDGIGKYPNIQNVLTEDEK